MSARSGRENEFWMPQLIFAMRRVFVCASGPSLTREICATIADEPTIVVNSSYTLAPEADILFFTDNSWFLQRVEKLEPWKDRIITLSKRAKGLWPDHVRRIQEVADRPEFPMPGAPSVRKGRTSGHTAVALAVALGAVEIVLLGFDMRMDDRGREHHHDEYKKADPERYRQRDFGLYENEYIPAFAGWDAQAKKIGVTIYNATEGSALHEFEHVALSEILL